MPNLHPFIVHFPIALLALGFLTDAWATARRDERVWNIGWWLQKAGTIGVLFAVTTGLLAAQSQSIPEGARGVFDAHRQGAFISAALFAALALWRAGARGRLEGGRRALFLLIYAAGVGFVIFTGLDGGGWFSSSEWG